MKDRFGREINYMRISITDRCNYRCTYCMPEDGVESLEHSDILSYDDIEAIVAASVALGISKYRITGGEPLVRKDVPYLVNRLKAIGGVRDLSMTTNGALLYAYARDLKKSGLDRVNISMDTLDPYKFSKITRRGKLAEAIGGIQAAIDADLTPVKINIVLIKGFNDGEVVDFLRLTLDNPYEIRFIERMPIGSTATAEDAEFISCDEIRARLMGNSELSAMEKLPNGHNAEFYRLPGAQGTFGFITPMSNCFCARCNRIRVTADGKLKTCLHSHREIDLKPYLSNREMLKNRIAEAILEKEEKHLLLEGGKPIERRMNKIGG